MPPIVFATKIREINHAVCEELPAANPDFRQRIHERVFLDFAHNVSGGKVMKYLEMTWNIEDGRLACRRRELKSGSAETVSIPHSRSNEPEPETFVAIGRSGSNGEVNRAA